MMCMLCMMCMMVMMMEGKMIDKNYRLGTISFDDSSRNCTSDGGWKWPRASTRCGSSD